MTTANLEKLIAKNCDLLTEQEAAKYLDLAPGTLSVWRSVGRYNLRFYRIGRNIRYRLCDLDNWIASRSRENGATA